MPKYTIAYLKHDQAVFDKYLGPSLDKLTGTFTTAAMVADICPAANYNKILKLAATPYVIFTHQDINFSPDLLERLDDTFNKLDDSVGSLGLVGVDNNLIYRWSERNTTHQLATADGCFFVIKITGLLFDECTFNGFHLYVEDYCAQLKARQQKVYTIDIDGQYGSTSYLHHHNLTLTKFGCAWGDYYKYRSLLEHKWPGIKTT